MTRGVVKLPAKKMALTVVVSVLSFAVVVSALSFVAMRYLIDNPSLHAAIVVLSAIAGASVANIVYQNN